jgi:hypothetical protein
MVNRPILRKLRALTNGDLVNCQCTSIRVLCMIYSSTTERVAEGACEMIHTHHDIYALINVPTRRWYLQGTLG